MKDKFLNSLKFRSWSYFVLFALSILLLLEFFQIILIEPSYLNTLKKEVKTYTKNISDLYFRPAEDEEAIKLKHSDMYSLTVSNNACVIIYDKTKGTTSLAYDALGESGCAIYRDSNVNQKFIEDLDNSETDEILEQGQFIELSSQDVMVYGKKLTIEDNEYYIISNITLQSLNTLSKTIQGQ